jgi:hypothetical protein
MLESYGICFSTPRRNRWHTEPIDTDPASDNEGSDSRRDGSERAMSAARAGAEELAANLVSAA